MLPERDAILRALEQVIDPELHKPVTELDMVRDVVIHDGGRVEVTIALSATCRRGVSFEIDTPGDTRCRIWPRT